MIHLSPLEKYQLDLKRDDFQYDAAQENAVKHLQRLYEDLQNKPLPVAGFQKVLSGWKRIIAKQEPKPIQGLYFWGGVGRGKTYLVDTFYDCLPFKNKMRVHFHRFMHRVHDELKQLSKQSDPLKIIAKKFADETCIICFDEFFVSDITDAMILGTLFEELFAHNVTLVATSNIVPDELYRNGLQRARFIPAIEMLKETTKVLNVDGGNDYRLRALEQAELYYTPLGEAAHESMAACFLSLAPDEIEYDTNVEIEGRLIDCHAKGDDVIWFEFESICDGPRSQHDYIELAKEYHAVLVTDVPQFISQDDQARRFINMVDEFYDRRVKLAISAAAPIHELYQKGRLNFEFERTQSRLLEMQSHDYLAEAHKA